MNTKLLIYSLGITAAAAVSALEAQSPSPPALRNTIPVTVDNFIRAESDKYFSARVALSGIGKLGQVRELMPIDKQTVIRSNRDTLYSAGVFDLQAGPVTITLPDAGKRFMSALIIDQDEYALKTVYAPITFTVSKDDSETRYVLIGVRTFVNPKDPGGCQSGARSAGCDQTRTSRYGNIRGTKLGFSKPGQGPRGSDKARGGLD